MGSQICVMSLWGLVGFFSLVCVHASSVREEGVVNIDGGIGIAEIDENFICATLDWWPPEKCDYGTCAWDHASLLNLDLSNPILMNAIRAFWPLKIRLGGTLQDKVIYESKDSKQPCTQFRNDSSKMFGFTPGCLLMKRWDELNAFFKKAGALVVFGLNALAGKVIQANGSAAGPWDSSNAESLVRYTVEKGYAIHGWELGNELSGHGIGISISADQYAKDLVTLNNMLDEIYQDSKSKPLVIAPGGFFDATWFTEFINKTQNVLNVMTHHIYNLGAGSNEHLLERILNPSVLDNVVADFVNLENIIKNSWTSAVLWVGEAGGAYNSGRNHVSNAFVYSFWYLDQLGLASKYDTKTYCRQSLIGGNYGLLNTTTFVPNPDYYSALLWHRLMGRTVLSTRFSGTNNIRVYAHCSKLSSGVTLLLINLSGNTTVEANLAFSAPLSSQTQRTGSVHRRKQNVDVRSEYHLTAKDRDLQSQVMLLNGDILTVNSAGEIPSLKPLHVNSSEPIIVEPYSSVFVHMPFMILPACK